VKSIDSALRTTVARGRLTQGYLETPPACSDSFSSNSSTR